MAGLAILKHPYDLSDEVGNEDLWAPPAVWQVSGLFMIGGRIPSAEFFGMELIP